MDTFTVLFQRLGPSQQAAFREKWGTEPWKNSILNRPENRRAWKQELLTPPWRRWREEQAPPLEMALRAKNRRAAGEILSNTPSLPREEAGRCALLTLQWAPELLEQILGKMSGPPHLWLRHRITLPSPQHQLQLQGSLSMIAAALGDLTSLKIILRHGGRADFNFLRDRWDIIADMLCGGGVVDTKSVPVFTLQYGFCITPESDQTLFNADPLSAAIFCGHTHCALYLLRHCHAPITPAVRRALAVTCGQPVQQAVTDAMGIPLENLLLPEDLPLGMPQPLFLKVVQRTPTVSPQQMHTLVHNLRSEQFSSADILAAFRCMDADALGLAVWKEVTNFRCYHKEALLCLAQKLHLPLDRCAVSDETGRDNLAAALRSFRITGAPPENGLSGLAVCILRQMEQRRSWETAMTAQQIMNLPGAMKVLQKEDPAMILSYLDRTDCIPAAQVLPLLSLLGVRKEVAYEL